MSTTCGSLAAALDIDLDEAVLQGGGSVVLQAVTHDSRVVAPGTLFCCVPGEHHDGHDFASQAVAADCSALLVERFLDQPASVAATPQIRVRSVRAAMGPAAAIVHERPSERIAVIGVTGTNGKTSVVHLLGIVLNRLGILTETIGTLSGARTTPEGPELQAMLADAANRGVRAMAIEVSSHALDLHRVDGTHFAAAVFTNLGHDHLDFHHTMEAYQAAKAQLFRRTFTETSIINLDDPAGQTIANETDTDVIGYRLSDATDVVLDGPQSRFTWAGQPVVLRLAGAHNIANALAAAAVARHLGFGPEEVADALCAVDAPRGRFEFVNVGQDFHVIVDYAHKPEALSAVLEAARDVAGDNKVLVVIGCGGDRDRAKRPLMGRVSAEAADHAYFTSDNPRSEKPLVIIDEMLTGLGAGPPAGEPVRSGAAENVTVEVDRRKAIAAAIAAAGPGDVVLIAGKGHEDYQVINDVTVPFDDRLVAAELIMGSDA